MHLVVLRFSAIGDVALTLPVLRGLLIINPTLKITLVSNPMFGAFFRDVDRLQLFPADFKEKYAGLRGLYRLSKDLAAIGDFDYVIDLHGVIRSYILCLLFSIKGKHIYRIDKGRKDKRDLIKGRIFHPLKHTTERYLDVFRHMPLKTWIPFDSYFNMDPESLEKLLKRFPKKAKESWIGIAPFSKHHLKNWSLEYMKSLMRMIAKNVNVRFIIFGGGPKELAEIDRMTSDFPGSMNAARDLNFNEELDLISQLDVMISMDSANMHMASLAGVKTVTIWGATHPYAGFSAYHANNSLDIQITKEELHCRPCTVFGQGTCHRGDFACMNWLTPEKVYQEIRKAGFV